MDKRRKARDRGNFHLVDGGPVVSDLLGKAFQRSVYGLLLTAVLLLLVALSSPEVRSNTEALVVLPLVVGLLFAIVGALYDSFEASES